MWGLYEEKLNAYGSTTCERQTNQAIEDFQREAVNNPSYVVANRNGTEEEFLITRSDKTERFEITAFPGKELNIGDYIEVWGEVFLVYQVRAQDTLNKTGVLWQCNHKFRWQNFDSTIIERWGILDSGVYSTTIRGEEDVKYKNKQFKLLLPLDDDTKKIYIDKRIAVDKMYDRRGNQILNVYKITGYDASGENFGAGAHILYLNIQSDEYNDETDNVEEEICDYISATTDTSTGTGLSCEISGSATIRAGTKRKYSAKFFNANNAEVTGLTPTWGYDTLIGGITANICSDGKLQITIPDDNALIGHTFKIYMTSDSGGYKTSQFEITIIGL